MAYRRSSPQYRILSPQEIEAWRRIPAAVASDCMNRTMAMGAEIRQLIPGGRPICGQARTVVAMSGESAIISMAAAQARPGEVLVVNALSSENVAVWGGMMTEAAVVRGLEGLVLDGVIRDTADARRLGFPVYCRGAVPRGPHTGFGGDIDVPVAVGGVPVSPGDIVIGDDDGITVVPLGISDNILADANAHLEKEADWLRRIRAGESIPTIFNRAPPQDMG